MTNLKTVLGAGAASLVLAVTLGSAVSSANLLNDKGVRGQGRSFSSDRHLEMEKLMEEKDYDAWKELMEKSPMKERMFKVIESKEDFEKFVESFSLRKNGDINGAKEKMEELGLNDSKKSWKKSDKGERKGFDLTEEEKVKREDYRNEMEKVMDSGNYEDWKKLVSESPNKGQNLLEIIDIETKFKKLQTAHNLIKEGKLKFEEAKEIKEELGFKMRNPRKGVSRGMDHFKGPRG